MGRLCWQSTVYIIYGPNYVWLEREESCRTVGTIKKNEKKGHYYYCVSSVDLPFFFFYWIPIVLFLKSNSNRTKKVNRVKRSFRVHTNAGRLG